MSRVLIEGLQKRFGDRAVLPYFNLDITDGEFVVLLGPSGCGKTTALRCLAGLEHPDGGRITISDQVVEDRARRLSVPTQNRDLGFVFQNYALWPHMTVHDNIAYPLRMRRHARHDIYRRVAEMLDLVALDGLAERTPDQLSGGQQQRVALARALAARPRVLLLDEPLSNLDAQRRNTLRRQLRTIHREVRTTTLYVTHDQIEALTMADRVLVMNQGRIEQSGAPRDVFERPANRFVADFLGYENVLRGRVTRCAGRFVTVQSDDWGGEIQVESPSRLAAGTAVELAFRASNVALHGPGHEVEPALSNVRIGAIKDVTYLGDTSEYVLQVGAGEIIARIPAHRETDRDDGPGSQRSLSVAPQNVVLLESGDANIARLPQAGALRLTG